jgi:hypothetical protein
MPNELTGNGELLECHERASDPGRGELRVVHRDQHGKSTHAETSNEPTSWA